MKILEDFDIFVKVYEGHTFSDISRVLEKDRSAIYRDFRKFELSVGTSLFITNKKKLIPTSAADKLYPIIKEYLIKFHGCIQDIYSSQNNVSGMLRIGTTQSILATWFPTFIKEFLEYYPKLQCTLIAANFTNLSNQAYDVLIGGKIDDENYISQKIFSHTMKLYASEDYIKKHGLPLSFKDLEHHSILAFASQKTAPYKDLNKHLTYCPKITPRIFIDSGLGMVRAVDVGLGIGPISNDVGVSLCKSLLINVLPTYKNETIENYLSYPKKLEDETKIQKLLAYTQSKVSFFNFF